MQQDFEFCEQLDDDDNYNIIYDMIYVVGS